jgi:hypothetical protein
VPFAEAGGQTVQAVDPCVTATATASPTQTASAIATATATVDPGSGAGVPTTTTTVVENIPATGGSPSLITLVGVMTMLVGVAVVVAAGTGRKRSGDAAG